jgi:hypothetical protein
MAGKRNPAAPPGLGTEGRSFWREVVKGWEMTPDGLRLLARAARLLDTLATLDAALKGADLILAGSRGQAIANPILTERRLHELAFAQICRQLRLEDEEPGQGWSGLTNSERARKAAMARWRKQG